MKVFVAGGTGFVGKEVVKSLLAQGHEVRLLLRSDKGRSWEPGITPAKGDITRPETLRGLLQGCQAVINLVGIIREFPSRGITFERAHFEGTRNLVDAAREQGVERFLQMSALGVRPGAVSQYHCTKARAEEYIMNQGLAYTIYRPSAIFGPQDDFINRLAAMVRLPLTPVIGEGRNLLQPVAVEVIGQGFARALERPQTVGKIYEVGGPRAYTYVEILDIIGGILGKKVRKVHFPVGFMKGMTAMLQRVPAFPLTSDQLIMLLEDNATEDRDFYWDLEIEGRDFEAGIRTYLKP